MFQKSKIMYLKIRSAHGPSFLSPAQHNFMIFCPVWPGTSGENIKMSRMNMHKIPNFEIFMLIGIKRNSNDNQ